MNNIVELSDKVLLEPYVWKRTCTVLKRVRTSNRPILSNMSLPCFCAIHPRPKKRSWYSCTIKIKIEEKHFPQNYITRKNLGPLAALFWILIDVLKEPLYLMLTGFSTSLCFPAEKALVAKPNAPLYLSFLDDFKV